MQPGEYIINIDVPIQGARRDLHTEIYSVLMEIIKFGFCRRTHRAKNMCISMS